MSSQSSETCRQLGNGRVSGVGISRPVSRGGARGSPSLGPNTPYRPPPQRDELYHRILEEIRCTTEEQRRMKEEMRRLTSLTSKVEEGLKSLNEELKQVLEASFTIEGSQYKDNLSREMGILFAKSLKRQASQEEIVRVIAKVLKNDAKSKQKFSKAKSFCTNRLTDLRCEERRRLFGNKPCESFVQLSTSEFADKFLSNLKAPGEYREIYIKNLALLRKFTREGENVRNDTYKKFRDWLDQKFTAGHPNDEEWTEILREDGENVPEYSNEYEVAIDNVDEY